MVFGRKQTQRNAFHSFSNAYGAGSFSGGTHASSHRPKPTLYLLVGYPGAGKSTAAKIIAGLTGATRISSDEIRLKMFPDPTFSPEEHSQLYEQVDAKVLRFLNDAKSVVYDANLNRYIHRQQKYAICRQTGAKPVLIWVQVPREVAKKRATHESRARLVPKHETASIMFDRIADIIEEPDPTEHPLIVDGQNVTESAIKKALGL